MIATVGVILHPTPHAYSGLIQGFPCIFTTITTNISLKIASNSFAIKPAATLLANSLKMNFYHCAYKMASMCSVMRQCYVLQCPTA